MNLPGHNPSVSPGMSTVIESGESYILKDDKGEELELVGRDRPWVIEFLSAFDHYMDITRTLNEAHPYSESAAKSLKEVWERIPNDLREQMPSYRAGGIKIDAHQH